MVRDTVWLVEVDVEKKLVMVLEKEDGVGYLSSHFVLA